MSALTRARLGSLWKAFRTLDAKIAAGQKIFKGATCGFKDGYLYPWTEDDPDLTHPCIAIPNIDANDNAASSQVVDNTDGNDGDLLCPVDFGREITCYLFLNDADAALDQNSIGGDAWGMDDQTVSASPGSRSRIGTPWFIQGSNVMGWRPGVYVELDGESGGTSELSQQIGLPIARNIVFANIVSLSAYTVASDAATNDNVLGVEDDVIALVAQTTPTQNGLYRVGVVATGIAPLTRISSAPTGTVLPNGITFEVGPEGGIYKNSTWKATSTTAGGWTVGTNDAKFYPRVYKQLITLASGTYTIGVGSTATPDEPLFLLAGATVGFGHNTSGGTLGTAKYAAPTASRVVGLPGTSKIVVNSLVDAGTVAGSDSSTVDVTVNNW